MTSDDAMRLADDCELNDSQIGKVCAAIRYAYRKGVRDCRKIAAGEIDSSAGRYILSRIEGLLKGE